MVCLKHSSHVIHLNIHLMKQEVGRCCRRKCCSSITTLSCFSTAVTCRICERLCPPAQRCQMGSKAENMPSVCVWKRRHSITNNHLMALSSAEIHVEHFIWRINMQRKMKMKNYDVLLLMVNCTYFFALFCWYYFIKMASWLDSDAVSPVLCVLSSCVRCCIDSLGLIFIFLAVGTSAVGFPHEGHGLELNPRETQPTPGLAYWGLQPGRLPRCPGGPPQRKWQVGGKKHTSSPTLGLVFSLGNVCRWRALNNKEILVRVSR